MDQKKLSEIQKAADNIIQQTTFLINLSRLRVNKIREEAELINELAASLKDTDDEQSLRRNS